MIKLPIQTERLLKEILEHRDDMGNCNCKFWNEYLEKSSESEESIFRSYLKQLRDAEMINYHCGSGEIYDMEILARGSLYFDEIKEMQSRETQSHYVNNFYGSVNGVQIQQGNKDSIQIQNNSDSDIDGKIEEVLKSIKKYDACLDEEFGIESANKVRKYAQDLSDELHVGKSKERMKVILQYIKDICINASGGIISAGFIQLINSFLG